MSSRTSEASVGILFAVRAARRNTADPDGRCAPAG
jgi:hypothetical protein